MGRRLAACACVLLAFNLFVEAKDATRDLEKTLADRFHGQLFWLRTPYVGTQLRFDDSGSIIGKAAIGTLAADRCIQVSGFRLRKGAFQLDGIRCVLFLDSQSYPRALVGPSVCRIEVRIAGQVNEDAISDAIRRVFVSQAQAQPPRSITRFQSPAFELSEDRTHVRPKGTEQWRRPLELNDAVPYGELEPGVPFYLVTGALVPPRLLKSLDPTFPESERIERQEGIVVMSVVINQRGLVHTMWILRALNHAFELEAVRAVSQWQFEPARLQGQAVAVVVNIEINFRLYR